MSAARWRALEGDRRRAPRHARRERPRLDARLRPGAVNAHTHLYSGLAPLGMPAPAAPPASFLEILERVWWRLDRALDEALAARRRRGSTSPRRCSPARPRSSITTSRRTSSRARSTCSPTPARSSACAPSLCYGATERNGGREEARRGLAECRRFIATNRRAARCAAWSGCTRRSPSPTRRCARRGGSVRELGTVRPRARRRGPSPTSRTRGGAATRARWSGCSRWARCRPARSSRTACTSTRPQVRQRRRARLLAGAEPALERGQPRRLPARARARAAAWRSAPTAIPRTC